MAAKERALSIVLAIVAIFASSSAFASIPRVTILDEQSSIDFRHEAPAVVDATFTIDNAVLLEHAIDAALIEPAPVESLSESRVWVSRLERPLFVQPEPLLSRSLHRGSVAAWAEVASDQSVLTPDPLGYVDSSNLYAFAGGDPVNGRDPRGTNSKTDSTSSNCTPVLVVNDAPFKPYLIDCNGSRTEVSVDEPVAGIDSSVPVMYAASSSATEPSLPYTKYGSIGDKGLATAQFVGNMVNGFDNAVRSVFQGPGAQIDSYFVPQSQVQARVQERWEEVAAVLGAVELGVGGVRMTRRGFAREPIIEPKVEANFKTNSRTTYWDSNPTARDPAYRTEVRMDGLSKANSRASGMHAEPGAMAQAYEAGVRGGRGELNVDVSPCRFCMNDIKAMARKLGLSRLTVIDHQTMTEYEFIGNDLKTVKNGGKRWKEVKKKQ